MQLRLSVAVLRIDELSKMKWHIYLMFLVAKKAPVSHFSCANLPMYPLSPPRGLPSLPPVHKGSPTHPWLRTTDLVYCMTKWLIIMLCSARVPHHHDLVHVQAFMTKQKPWAISWRWPYSVYIITWLIQMCAFYNLYVNVFPLQLVQVYHSFLVFKCRQANNIQSTRLVAVKFQRGLFFFYISTYWINTHWNVAEWKWFANPFSI